MKKILLSGLLTALLLTTALAGCVVVKEDVGNLETRQYDLTGFTAVDIGSAFDYEIVQADVYGVSITADSDLFTSMEVDVVGDTLRISFDDFPQFGWFGNIPGFKARVAMPRLTGLEASGASDGDVNGFSSEDDLDISLSGASSLNMYDMTVGAVDMEMSGASDADINIAAAAAAFDLSGASDLDGDMAVRGDIEVEMSGASSLELLGSAQNARLDASGASSLDMENFTVHDADVEFSGASSGTINLDGRLDVDLSGASYLSYVGEPQLGDFDVSGGSELENEDD